MAKLTTLYGHPTDPAAFEEHYANTHAPLVEKIPNLRQFEAGKIIATPDGSEPPYYWIADCISRAWSSCRAVWVRQKGRQRRRTL